MPEEVTRDAAIASLAATQHGVVSAEQLRDTWVPDSTMGDRVRSGRLHRIHRGVYAVGHPQLSDEGRWMAAVLACGDGAVLSHRSAAELWRMLRTGQSASPVHVTVAGEGRHRPGIHVHRSSTLSPAACALRSGIPVTTPARTLADVRRSFPRQVFARALREAEFLGLPLGERITADRTRSELEARFLTLVGRHRLPQPVVNARINRFVVDFLWRSERLIVEVDGWEAHRSRSAFEEDRARDVRLAALGFHVLRFTWRQIEDGPAAIAAAIRSVLRRAA
jgi:very-short-patch-repair endonuclease